MSPPSLKLGEILAIAQNIAETPESRLAALPDPLVGEALQQLRDARHGLQSHVTAMMTAEARLIRCWTGGMHHG